MEQSFLLFIYFDIIKILINILIKILIKFNKGANNINLLIVGFFKRSHYEKKIFIF